MFDEVFAVDRSSSDGTLDVYRQYKIRVVDQKLPGRGEAFKLAEQSTTADAIVYFSPDGNEDPGDFFKFRLYLDQGADIVIASRMMGGAFNEEDVSWWRPRKWANNIFNFAANVFWNRSGKYISDSINGYRALRRGLINELRLDASGYTIEYQTTIRALKKSLNIVEFPTREGQRIAGATKADSIRVGTQFLKCLFKEIWLSCRFRGFTAFILGSALLAGLVYVLPPLLIEREIVQRGGSFLLVQPETYRDEFFSYLPRDREIFDGHFPAAGPYADDIPRTLMNPLPPILFSAFLYLAGGDVNGAYLAAQFIFVAAAFLLFYFLGLAMTNSRLWGLLFGFIGVFTHLTQKFFLYNYRDPLSIYVKDFLPFVRTPIPKLHLARIDDPLLTMPFFVAAILAIYLFWKKPKASYAVLAAVLTGLLAYLYLHHWLLVMMIVGVSFLLVLLWNRRDKPRIKNYLLMFAILAVISAPYFINNFSFLATYGKDFALRVGLEEDRFLGLKFLFTEPAIIGSHFIYAIILLAVYLVYFKWLKNKEKGFFMLACVLSMFFVWQIPLVLGSIPQLSHFLKSNSLIALILLFNLAYDAQSKLTGRTKRAVAIVVVVLIAGLVGKKVINVFQFINPPADIVESYSFPKDLLDSWRWIDGNLGPEPQIVSSSLVTSLYLAGNTSARPFLPTGFISSLPTTELEKRFLTVNKLFGVSPEILGRRFNDFNDQYQDRCFGEPCFRSSHFNFTKNRWYLTEHGWYMTRMANESDRVLGEYKNMKVSWKETGADYVYYGPWERQFSSVNLSADSGLKQVYKNSLVEIYRIER